MSEMLRRFLHASETHVYITTTITFFIFGGLFVYLTDRATPRRGRLLVDLANHYFPWVHWRSPSVRIDAAFYLFVKFAQGYIATLSTLITVALATGIQHGLAGWVHGPATLSSGTVALVVTAIVLYIFNDIGMFISHMMQHTIKPLWEFHKIHHSSTFLMPLTMHRSHPVSNILDAVIIGVLTAVPAGVAAFACGFSFDQLFLLSGSVNLAFEVGILSALQHSHFPISFGKLEYIIVSPLMHQLHHSTKREHWNKNYGSRLSIWDWCFGTAMTVPKGEKIEFGLNPVEDQRGDYSSLLWCFAGPFVVCSRMLLRKGGDVHARRPAPSVDTGCADLQQSGATLVES